MYKESIEVLRRVKSCEERTWSAGEVRAMLDARDRLHSLREAIEARRQARILRAEGHEHAANACRFVVARHLRLYK